MKRKILFFFFLLFISLVHLAQAKEIIWQIGTPDGSYREFSSPKKRIIEYRVPSNWEELAIMSDPNWGEFPRALFSPGSGEDNPQEIRIHFSYQKDHGNPVLTVKIMKSTSTSGEICIHILKGEDQLLEDNHFYEEKVTRNNSFYSYTFPMAYIKRGVQKENTIIIRTSGTPGASIIFDTVYLGFEDSDGDGVYDSEEDDPEEGGPYSKNPNIVCIPIPHYSPHYLREKLIILEIEESQKAFCRFYEAGFIDPGSLNVPGWLQSERFIPHGYLGFKIESTELPIEQVKLQLTYNNSLNPDDILDPSLLFYTYQANAEWVELPFEFLDDHSVMITLFDGGRGDFDDQKNGRIDTILAQTYSTNFGIHIQRNGCFLQAFR